MRTNPDTGTPFQVNVMVDGSSPKLVPVKVTVAPPAVGTPYGSSG
jgi:hypothetical protein